MARLWNGGDVATQGARGGAVAKAIVRVTHLAILTGSCKVAFLATSKAEGFFQVTAM